MHTKTASRQRGHQNFDAGNAGGERGTRRVVLPTTVMMVGEVVAGWLTNSMAMLADGWHLGTHVAALGITAFAYWYARPHQHSHDLSDPPDGPTATRTTRRCDNPLPGHPPPKR